MRTRTLLKPILDARWTTPAQLPPTFLLPWRARLHQSATVTQIQDMPPDMLSASAPPPDFHPQQERAFPTAALQPTSIEAAASSVPTPLLSDNSSPSSPFSKKPLILSKSIQDLLPHLTSQPPYYITAHIHRFPYLLTTGDTLRLPFHMPGVSPGDILRLNRASLLGSRDYTLKAGAERTETYDAKRTGEPNYLDERLFECRVRVLGVDSTPMMVEEKTKRRQRRVKTVRSKHRYTVMKVMEVKVKTMEELLAGDEQIILGS